MYTLSRISLLLSVSLLAAGCSSLPRQESKRVDQTRLTLQQLREQQQEQTAAQRAVQINQGYYFGDGQTIPLPREIHLPANFQQNVTLVTPPLYLYQIADKVAQVAALPVKLGTLLQQKQQNAQTQQQGNLMEKTGDLYAVDYQGSLRGLLDRVAAHYGVGWVYRHGEVVFELYITRTYTLDSLPGSITAQTVISNQSSTGTGSGGAAGMAVGGATSNSAQSITANTTDSEWTDVQANVKSMLSADGHVVANENAGTVTVTDTPSVITRVDEYMAGINQSLSRQVAITVHVYSLEINNIGDNTFSLNLVFNDLKQQWSAGVTGLTPSFDTTGNSSLTTTILNTAGATNGALGQWSGTQLLMNILSQYGKVSLVTSGSGYALQGQPLPIQVTETQGYLAESQTTTSANVGATNALIPGQVTTGFSMIVTPLIMANRQMMLQYTIDLSTLNSLTTISNAQGEIQVPDVSSRRFLSRVKMNSGATLVLAGYEQTGNNSTNERGLTSVGNFGQRSRKIIFITLTATKV